MNRRQFIYSGLITGAAVSLGSKALAQTSQTQAQCVLSLDQITAEATYFTRYEHFHILALPVSVLISPPAEGFRTQTSRLDQGSLDEAAFMQFIRETGLDEQGLRHHKHDVTFTKQELERIASGEQNVRITVMTPKGNIGHHFFFTAPRSAIVKIQKARGRGRA